MFKDEIHPTHGLFKARFFLNRNILRVNNVAVTVGYTQSRGSVEDVGHPGYDYTLTRADDGRVMYAGGLNSIWRPRCGPDQVDWASLDLRITAEETNELGVPRHIQFSLYGLENSQVLKEAVPKPWSWFAHKQGFFPADSLVVREFKRRLSIENAEKRIEAAKKTLQKHLALGPYVTD